jgi:hypothetical protein
MERRKFFKNMIGIAALPLIPDFMKDVAPQGKAAGTLFTDLSFFRLGDVVTFGGGQGLIVTIDNICNEILIRPLSASVDLGAGAGSTAKWKISDKPDKPVRLYQTECR